MSDRVGDDAQATVDDFKLDGVFQDRPLRKGPKAEQGIARLISMSKSLAGQAEYGVEATTKTAVLLAEDQTQLDQLETSLFGLLDQLAIVQARTNILLEYQRRLKASDEIAGLVADYERQAAEVATRRLAQTKRQRFKRDENYIKFREQVWEVTNVHEPCPPMSHFLDKEDGDQSDDDEFEMGGQTQTFKCPITLMTLENAVTSESCKHSYTKAAVINLIESGRGRATCPVAGCDKILTMATLKTDNLLQQRADAYERRQIQSDNDDQDDEDVV